MLHLFFNTLSLGLRADVQQRADWLRHEWTGRPIPDALLRAAAFLPLWFFSSIWSFLQWLLLSPYVLGCSVSSPQFSPSSGHLGLSWVMLSRSQSTFLEVVWLDLCSLPHSSSKGSCFAGLSLIRSRGHTLEVYSLGARKALSSQKGFHSDHVTLTMGCVLNLLRSASVS